MREVGESNWITLQKRQSVKHKGFSGFSGFSGSCHPYWKRQRIAGQDSGILFHVEDSRERRVFTAVCTDESGWEGHTKKDAANLHHLGMQVMYPSNKNAVSSAPVSSEVSDPVRIGSMP